MTGDVLAALVLGLPAYVLVKVLVPNFYARADTNTPVVAAFISLAVFIAFNFVFLDRYGVVGVALASVVGAWINVAFPADRARHARLLRHPRRPAVPHRTAGGGRRGDGRSLVLRPGPANRMVRRRPGRAAGCASGARRSGGHRLFRHCLCGRRNRPAAHRRPYKKKAP